MEQTVTRRQEIASFKRYDGRILNRISQGIFVIFGLYILYVLGSALWTNPKVFIEQVLNGLQLGFIYALIALGYTMVYGIVRLINFAHGDVFMIGAFTSFYTVSVMELHRWPERLLGLGEPWGTLLGTVSVIIGSMLVSGTLAVIVERFAYRPLRSKPRIAALITAIGISFFLEYFGGLGFVYSNNYITYSRPFELQVYSAGMVPMAVIVGMWILFLVSAGAYGFFYWRGKQGDLAAQVWMRHPLLRLGLLIGGFMSVVLTLSGIEITTGGKVWDLTTSNVTLVIMGASIILQVMLQYIVNNTRLGKAMRATAYDKPASRLMGINVDMVIASTFALGGGLAGAAGVLYATTFKQVHHLMGIIPGLKAFIAAVVGGIGSIPGAFVGSLIMGQTETMAASFISTPMRDAISFSLLIIVLLIWPQGIFGEPPGDKV